MCESCFICIGYENTCKRNERINIRLSLECEKTGNGEPKYIRNDGEIEIGQE